MSHIEILKYSFEVKEIEKISRSNKIENDFQGSYDNDLESRSDLKTNKELTLAYKHIFLKIMRYIIYTIHKPPSQKFECMNAS